MAVKVWGHKILHMVQTQNKPTVQKNSPTLHMFEASCMKKKRWNILKACLILCCLWCKRKQHPILGMKIECLREEGTGTWRRVLRVNGELSKRSHAFQISGQTQCVFFAQISQDPVQMDSGQLHCGRRHLGYWQRGAGLGVPVDVLGTRDLWCWTLCVS